jgi:hypothetical protein
VLRQLWPRWTDALVLVQPATVDRWHREGFHRCWHRRSRRPGRPRIDSECRGLIQRLAAENCLWGAPRIHGELLKLGIVVSERTVSRYLPDRLRAPSQTWRTFLANHLGQFTLISPETPLYALCGDDVVDGADLTFRQTPCCAMRSTPLINARSASVPSLQRTLPGKHIVQDHLHDRISIRTSSGRGPPPHGRFGRLTCIPGESIGAPAPDLSDERRCQTIGRAGGRSPSWSTSSADDPSSFGRRVHLRAGVSPQSEYWRGTARARDRALPRHPRPLALASAEGQVPTGETAVPLCTALRAGVVQRRRPEAASEQLLQLRLELPDRHFSSDSRRQPARSGGRCDVRVDYRTGRS